MAIISPWFHVKVISSQPKDLPLSLRALDLAQWKRSNKSTGPFPKLNSVWNLDIYDQEQLLCKRFDEGAADYCLEQYMGIFELNFLDSMYDSKLEGALLEENIYKYLSFARKFYRKKRKIDIEAMFGRMSSFMFERNITNGYLWMMLLDLLYLAEMVVPTIFMAYHPMKLRFILKILRQYSVFSHGQDYGTFQRLISVDSCMKHGSYELLKVLLQMGHEISLEDMEKVQPPAYWVDHFYRSLPFIKSRKPKDMSLRRYLLHLLMFAYACNRDSHEYRQFPKMLKLLWRAIPDSLITRKEIDRVFEDEIGRESQETVRQIHEMWHRLFCNCTSQPRSLKHYARCSVRRALNCRFQLPEVIYQLPLPPSIKSYLNLEC